MNTPLVETCFAQAARLPLEDIHHLPAALARVEQLQWLERMPFMIFLVNPCRQIVYSNPSFTEAVNPENRSRLFGLRPGEALGCVHAKEMPGGCGCSHSCRHCGAAQAILKSLRGVEDCRECHILVRNDIGFHAVDLQILSRPFSFEGQTYSLNTALDISHERRLAALNRSFLHGMINAAGGMEILLSLLNTGERETLLEHLPILHHCALTMLQEVLYQYDVTAAELGRLAVRAETFDVATVLERMLEQLRRHPVAQGKSIELQSSACPVRSDPRLVRHIVSSLVINALEAIQGEGVVTVTCLPTDAGVDVIVENSGHISEEIAAHLFTRFVSSKGRERGLGLHTAKVFAENHLHGRLQYAPGPEVVRFILTLPAEL